MFVKLFDLHCHTSGISRCCQLTKEQIVDTALQNGYNGIVLTNHYTKTYLDGRPFSEWIEDYINEYLATKQYGAQHGLEVLFGVEVTSEQNRAIHILLYGATPDFLRENPALYDLDYADLYNLCRQNDICVIHAHPYRNGASPLPFNVCDGYEINCHPLYDSTRSAEILDMQKEYGCVLTCGCDYHGDTYRPKAGTYVDETIRDEKDLAHFLLTTQTVTLSVQELRCDRLDEYQIAVQR